MLCALTFESATMMLDLRQTFSSPAIQMCLANTRVHSPRPPAPTINIFTGATSTRQGNL